MADGTIVDFRASSPEIELITTMAILKAADANATNVEAVGTRIDEQQIPDDVTIQVLTPARDELIRATFESLRGVRRAGEWDPGAARVADMLA